MITASSARELTPLAVEWLEMLPPILGSDPWVQAIFGALAREMERINAYAEAVGEGLIPTTANVYTLPLWEALLGLPVNPQGTSEEVRRELVLSRTLRGDGSGEQWEAQMEAATDGSYRYTENDSGDPRAPRYSLAIDTALPPGVTAEALRSHVRQITPANLHIDVQGGQTYAQVKAAQADYTAARNAVPNYDNMRFGTTA